jgi:hypothetical protein
MKTLQIEPSGHVTYTAVLSSEDPNSVHQLQPSNTSVSMHQNRPPSPLPKQRCHHGHPNKAKVKHLGFYLGMALHIPARANQCRQTRHCPNTDTQCFTLPHEPDRPLPEDPNLEHPLYQILASESLALATAMRLPHVLKTDTQCSSEKQLAINIAPIILYRRPAQASDETLR